MPSTPDPLKGRLWEELVYGTPAYRFSTTPDGRIVTEQYRTRREGEQHHRELIGIQRDVIGALKDLHDGQSVVTREEYLRKEDETQGILRQAAGSLWTLHADQQALLDENRALGQITQRGFGELQEGVEGVRQSVEESTHTLHGPEYPAASIADVSRRQGNFVEALAAYKKGILSDGAKRDLERLINSRTALPQPRRQRVRQFLTTAIGDDEFVDAGGQYPLQTYVPMATSVIDNPAELIGPNAGEALGKLRVLALAERNHPDDELRGFIRDAFAIAGVAGRAKDMPLSEAFVADLANSGLVTDGIQHEVKRFVRDARLGGTDVDRNYNLMELLEQGDYARAQRDALVALSHEHIGLARRTLDLGERRVQQGTEANVHLVSLREQGERTLEQGRNIIGLETAQLHLGLVQMRQGDEAHRQRGTLIDLAETQVDIGLESLRQGAEVNEHLGSIADQTGELVNLGRAEIGLGLEGLRQREVLIRQGHIGNRHLANITSSLAGVNEHLVNLEELGRHAVEAMDYGFGEVVGVLERAVIMQDAHLEEVAAEIGFARASIVAQLQDTEDILVLTGEGIKTEIAYGNRLLESLVDLTAHRLRSEARERFQQGLTLLDTAEQENDIKEAYGVFVEGTTRDPTVVENQYGCGVAAELTGDFFEAKKRYRVVCRVAPKDKGGLVSGAYKNLGRIAEKEGNIPEAMKHLKAALAKDESNIQAQWLMARCLALAGLTAEAIEAINFVVRERPQYLLRLKLDPAFIAVPAGIIYCKVCDERKIHIPEILAYLFEEFLELGDEKRAMIILQSLIDMRPEEILKQGVLRFAVGKRKTVIEKEFRKLLTKKSNTYTAEAWYAIVFILLALDFPLEDITKILRHGLEQDPDFYRKKKDTLQQRLKSIGGANTEILFQKLIPVAKDLHWILT